MTTPFTAPKECSVYFVGTESRSSTTTLRAGLAWIEYYKIAVNQSMTCFPPQFDEYVRFRSFLVKEIYEGYGTSHFTSTAMLAPFYCLDGWEVATSIVPSLSSTWSICCPSYVSSSAFLYSFAWYYADPSVLGPMRYPPKRCHNPMNLSVFLLLAIRIRSHTLAWPPAQFRGRRILHSR